jgi:hypothetical protein
MEIFLRGKLSSVADPGCLSRIRIKEFKYFDPNKWFLSSRKYRMIRVVHPGSGSLFFTHPGSMGQNGTGSQIHGSKRHRIPDPQHRGKLFCQEHICLETVSSHLPTFLSKLPEYSTVPVTVYCDLAHY